MDPAWPPGSEHRVAEYEALTGCPVHLLFRIDTLVDQLLERGAGFDEVLQEFDGGPGQVALHGLANVGGVPGSAVSHGCVRLDNDVMRWLVARIGPGVPVTITS
jgi:hypothetical protein